VGAGSSDITVVIIVCSIVFVAILAIIVWRVRVNILAKRKSLILILEAKKLP
jgi:hypothetical protein